MANKPRERSRRTQSRRAHSRRAQLFSIDLVVSLAIFLVVLLSATYLLTRMRSNIEAANEKNVLAASAFSALDALSYSPGYPHDWTPTNVNSIGLSLDSNGETAEFSGTRLDAAKLLRFAKLNESDARYLLGLGGFDFRFTLQEVWNASEQSAALVANASHSGIALEPIAYFAADDRDAFALLNGTGVVWDYYWAGSGIEPSHGDARNFYPAVIYGGNPLARADLFNAMLANATARNAYRTIVIEQPNFKLNEYANVSKSALRSFLKARGLIVFEGSVSAADAGQETTPLLVNDLNETLVFVGTQSGSVNQTSFFLDNVSASDKANFTQSKWAVYSNSTRGDAPLFVLVQNATNSSLALVARWDCEKGRIYYVADFNSSFGAYAIPDSSVFNLVGAKLDFGIAPSASASDAFVVQRPVIIQRDWGSLAVAKLVVWKS